MDELISRGAAIDEIDEYLQGLHLCISEPDLKLDGYKNGLQVAIQELKALPTINAIPVEWLCNYLNKIGMEPIDISEMVLTWRREKEAR